MLCLQVGMLAMWLIGGEDVANATPATLLHDQPSIEYLRCEQGQGFFPHSRCGWSSNRNFVWFSPPFPSYRTYSLESTFYDVEVQYLPPNLSRQVSKTMDHGGYYIIFSRPRDQWDGGSFYFLLTDVDVVQNRVENDADPRIHPNLSPIYVSRYSSYYLSLCREREGCSRNSWNLLGPSSCI